jgi:hypothetical protein
MRYSPVLVLLILLGACQRESSFEERYAQAERNLAQKASAIDNELSTAQTQEAKGTQDPARPEKDRQLQVQSN